MTSRTSRGWAWMLVAAASVIQREYDAANPAYGVKTDADGYAISLSAFRKLDIGTGDWRAFANVIHAENDSDVDFHDSAALAASVRHTEASRANHRAAKSIWPAPVFIITPSSGVCESPGQARLP